MWIHLLSLELIDGAGLVPVNTYMSYIKASEWLQTVVDGVEVSRQKASGDVDFLNDVSAQSRDVLRYAFLQG